MVALLIDEDVATGVAVALSSQGHDALTVADLQLRGSKDDAILWAAARLRRAVISHNAADFLMLHRAWHRWHVPEAHAGILIPRQRLVSRPADVAGEISRFFALDVPLEGELYTLEPVRGWQRFDVSAAIADTAIF